MVPQGGNAKKPVYHLTETGKKLAQHAPPPIQQKIIDGLKQTENAKKEQIVRSLNMLTSMHDVQELEVK